MTEPHLHSLPPEEGDGPRRDVGARLRAGLAGGVREMPVPADRDAAIRAAIRSAFNGRSPVRRWTFAGVARRAAIAAMLAIVAVMALRSGAGGPSPDRRLVAAARLSDLAREGRGSLADPALRALLSAVVALPTSPALGSSAEGEFMVVDLLLDASGPLPSAWFIEVEVPGLLAGIEGGDRPYDEPARYDPRALDGGVVRLAGVRGLGDAPHGTQRLCSLTLRRSADGDAAVTNASLIGPGGETLAITVRCVARALEVSDR